MIDRNVCTRTRVWLQVGVFCTEERLGAFDTNLFYLVDFFTAAVVALTGIALGILIGERRAQSGQNGRRGEVLTGDQLQIFALTIKLAEQNRCDIWVLCLEGIEIWAKEF